jgi:protein-tyrosine phosphatase
MMKYMGMDHVICLLEEKELEHFYPSGLIDRNRHFFSSYSVLPVEDMSVPSKETTSRIFSIIQDADKNNQTVLVHCNHGYGRTGLIQAGWLCLNYGMEPEEAVALVKEYAKRNGCSRNPLQAGGKAMSFLGDLL